MAHAWALLNTASEWTWSGAPARVQPAAAIVNVAAYLAGHCGGPTEDGLIALVVPNGTTEGAQQSLIDEANRLRLNVKLLWRPVAAAMTWCDRFASELEHLPHRFDEPMGRLLVLHLGLDEWEATVLEIVPQRHEDGRTHFLPARCRPALAKAPEGAGETLPSFGIHVMRALAVKLLEREGLAPEGDTVWRMLWATPFVRCVLSLVSGRDSSVNWEAAGVPLSRVRAEDVRQEWLDAIRCVSSGGLRTVRFTWEPLAKCPTSQSILAWRNELDKHAANLLGAIFTGPLADVPITGDRRLGTKWLQGLSVGRVAVEGVDLPIGFMAEAASRYASRLQRMPTYLDTLPRLRIATRHRCRPAWVELLSKQYECEYVLEPQNYCRYPPVSDKRVRYVPGGKTWRRDEPLQGLTLEPKKETLEVLLDHEDLERVLQASAFLPRPPEHRVPIELQVEMEPAGGHARIQAVPIPPDALGRRADIRVNTRSMQPYKDPQRLFDVTWQQWLDEQPRWFPELLRRGHSPAAWKLVKWGNLGYATVAEAITRFLKSRDPNELPQIRLALQKKIAPDDRILRDILPSHPFETPWFRLQERKQTPVSSEGEVRDQSEVLAELVDFLCSRLVTLGRFSESDVFRTLAFTSTDDTRLQQRLSELIAGELRRQERPQTRRGRSHVLKNEHLAACGWCLRKPAAIAAFAQVMSNELEDGTTRPNLWLKAFAEILRYRENALENVDTELALELADQLLEQWVDQFRPERGRRNPKFIFRNATLGIAFLLRRRWYDPDYLDPDGSLAQKIKQRFGQAVREHKAGRALIGGIVRLQEILTDVIDYIDKKGPPVPTSLAGLASGDDDEDE